MLASIVSQNVIQCSTVSITTSPGVPECWATAAISLIVLLSLREVLTTFRSWGQNLETSIDIGIFPLLYSFFAIVVFKIVEIP